MEEGDDVKVLQLLLAGGLLAVGEHLQQLRQERGSGQDGLLKSAVPCERASGTGQDLAEEGTNFILLHCGR
jgi:hypothetical protein